MSQLLDPLLILALVLNFVTLGVSRIRGVINAVALQGILLGTLPLFVHSKIGLRGALLVVLAGSALFDLGFVVFQSPLEGVF